MSKYFILLFVWGLGSVFAAEFEIPSEVSSEAPPIEKDDPAIESLIEDAKPDPAPLPVERAPVQVGGRCDLAFTGGESVYRGFYLPSYRLSAYGNPESWMRYRLSMGQTREYSTILLPQLVPSEAWSELSRDFDSSSVRTKFGMFRPHIIPVWTNDLSDLPLSSYFESDRRVLLDKDIGVEFGVGLSDHFKTSFGVFNGNGIIGYNSNSAYAFTANISILPSTGTIRSAVGVGGYLLRQSVRGNVNFKDSWAISPFAELTSHSFSISIHGLLGGFEESTLAFWPLGGAAFLQSLFSEVLGAFVKFETLRQVPITGGFVDTLEVGGVVTPSLYWKAFLYYTSLRRPGSAYDSGARALVRVSF